MQDITKLSKQLINLPSVTPDGANCIELLIPILEKLGFSIERFACGDALNLWARKGSAAPLVCFLGHVDVVPTGQLEQWQSPPFTVEERDGYLYGRGASDMKTGIAAIIVAIEQFLKHHANHPGSIAVLITTAEEAMDEFGVPNVVQALEGRHEKIDYCITAEPSSSERLGDIVRNGRRGSLSADLLVKGKQGHIAYPHLADNPIHKIFAAFAALTAVAWDKGNEFFPPTSFQFSNLQAGTGAGNVIPGIVEAKFNFRFSPEVTTDELIVRTETILQEYYLNYEIKWSCSAQPFYTAPGMLTDVVKQVIEQECGLTPEFSTGGGTSDARFIAPTGAQVVELGVSNKTAHQINECVNIHDLKKLPKLYESILEKLLKKPADFT
jgi:succinyl-diaminopimelate desuccinylase